MGLCETSNLSSSLSVVLAIWKFAHVTVSLAWWCFNTGSPISWKFKNKRNTWFILLLVSLFIGCSFWVDPSDFEQFLWFAMSPLFFSSYRETSQITKITQNHSDPPRNYTQWIKTHKEQDKSSIYFIFKFEWKRLQSDDVTSVLCCYRLRMLGRMPE